MIKVLWFSFVLGLSILTLRAYADISGDYEYTDNGNNTCTITDYTGPGGSISMPDTLDGLTVTVIGDLSFYDNDSLTSIVIPNSVTIIGYGAFYSCSNLASIRIPNSVSSVESLAFYNCDNLTNVTLGNSVTSIGDRAFYSCNGLICIYFKGNEPSYVGPFAFADVNATVYYISGTTGWGATFGASPTGALPTAEWPFPIADVDTDGDVNLWDFVTFAASWQSIDGVDAEYNPDCDFSEPFGIIDIADLQVFVEQWLITPCT